MQPQDKSIKQGAYIKQNHSPVMKHHFMPLCDNFEFHTEKFAGYSTTKFKV